MAREPLLRRHVGKVRCERYGRLKLCVIGGRYGFSGRLYAIDPSGKMNRRKWLPVSVNEARTPREALEYGKKFLRGVHGRNN